MKRRLHFTRQRLLFLAICCFFYTRGDYDDVDIIKHRLSFLQKFLCQTTTQHSLIHQPTNLIKNHKQIKQL